MSDATQHAHGTIVRTQCAHTPGKWTHKRRALIIPPKTSYICEVGHDWHVVSDIPRDGVDRSEANAALIAAAPDLLAEVQRLTAAYDALADKHAALVVECDTLRAALGGEP